MNYQIDLIIPLYNKKPFVLKTIQSALIQKKFSFNKIIIINDGSTDGIEIELKNIQKQFSSVEIFNQSNQGVSEARNFGLKQSKADFVVFLDADDFLSPYYLIEINKLIEKYYKKQKIFCFSTLHKNFFKKDKSSFIEDKKSDTALLKYPLLSYIFNKRIYCASGICFERTFISKFKFPKNVKIGEDIYLWQSIFVKNSLALSYLECIRINKYAQNRSDTNFYEIPYYLVNTKIIDKYKLSLKKYFIFIIYHISNIFIVLNQIKLNKNFKNKKNVIDIIVKKQTSINKILLILIKSNFSFYIFWFLVILKKNFFQFVNIFSFLNYIYVSICVPLVFFIFYINRDYEFATKFFIYASFFVIIFSFSQIHTKIFLNKFSMKKLSSFILIRFMLVSIFYIICVSLVFFISNKDTQIYLFSLNLVAFMVIFDFIIFYNDIKKRNFNLVISFLLISLLFLICFFKVNFYNINLFFSTTFILILINFIISSNNIFENNSIKLLIKNFKLINYINYFFLSAIFLAIATFFFRYFLSLQFDTYAVSTIMLIFSINTFCSTIYERIIAHYAIKQKNLINYYFNFSVAMLFVLHCIFIVYYIYLNNLFLPMSIFNHYLFLIFSFLGGIILLLATIKKQFLIFKIEKINRLIINDFLIYFLVILNVSFLFVTKNYVIFLFFTNAIISFVIYYFYTINNLNKKTLN